MLKIACVFYFYISHILGRRGREAEVGPHGDGPFPPAPPPPHNMPTIYQTYYENNVETNTEILKHNSLWRRRLNTFTKPIFKF